MKYKNAKEIIEKIKHYEEMDDLIVFKKPYIKTITFTMKDGTTKEMEMKKHSYISLSNHGFLFIQKEPYDIIAVHLNNVEDMMVR